MRFKALVVNLAIGLVIAHPAGAVLKHYNVHWTSISDFNTTFPTPDKFPNFGLQPNSAAIIDDSGASPVLKKLTLTLATTVTTYAPGLSGFIFSSRFTTEGPRKGVSYTGTGSTGTSIAWGVITGWSITGGIYCHSSPSFICGYASSVDLATVDPAIRSPFYDLGTWSFHGTGFTAQPFVWFVPPPANMSVGNASYQVRGRLSGGLIPALPVLGVALLGASLLFAGARLSRKR